MQGCTVVWEDTTLRLQWFGLWTPLTAPGLYLGATLPEGLSPATISLLSIYPRLLVQPTSCTTLFEAPRNEIETCSNLADFWFCPTLIYNQHLFFLFFFLYFCVNGIKWVWQLCWVGYLVMFLCKLNLFELFSARLLFLCVFSVA